MTHKVSLLKLPKVTYKPEETFFRIICFFLRAYWRSLSSLHPRFNHQRTQENKCNLCQCWQLWLDTLELIMGKMPKLKMCCCLLLYSPIPSLARMAMPFSPLSFQPSRCWRLGVGENSAACFCAYVWVFVKAGRFKGWWECQPWMPLLPRWLCHAPAALLREKQPLLAAMALSHLSPSTWSQLIRCRHDSAAVYLGFMYLSVCWWFMCLIHLGRFLCLCV